MGDSVRWNAMYTKHVKQKRKVYHDCFVQLQSSRNKVMLYDGYDKLLDSRFLKKDDVIKSGESLVFDSYLVDIGEQCEDCKHNSNFNHQENEIKIKVEENSDPSTISKSQNRRSTFGKTKAPAIKTCLSPSQKIIRDFKRSEMDKYNSSAHCLDTTEPTKTEWQVLYTTQLTQKAKKFHDGILQLVVRGSQRQVMLCDATRTQLDRRFLKKDEIVISGETLKFDGHLVEIGEQETTHDSVAGSILVEKKIKTDMVNNKVRVINNKKFSAGRTVFKTPPLKSVNISDSSINVERGKSSSRILADEPRRAVNEILSTLRKPIQKKHVITNNSLVEDQTELHSSDVVHSNIRDHMKDCADEFNVNLPEKFHKETSKVSPTLGSEERRQLELAILSKPREGEESETSTKSRINSGVHEDVSNLVAEDSNDCHELFDTEDKDLEKDSPTKMGEVPSFDLGF